jgi:hypothetical protein
MLPSFHDDYLASYEVNCETRRIKLYVRPCENGLANRVVIFTGVEGYQFENDAFGNIIFSLESISVEQLIAEYGSDIAESFRMAGAPGPWAADLASAPQALTAKRVQGFILNSSCGLSGWVLARDASVEIAAEG